MNVAPGLEEGCEQFPSFLKIVLARGSNELKNYTTDCLLKTRLD